ncbi:MAG TPA: aminoglycoside adenylyltransferase domain-containing protein [Streptosporangiaceae bacterium]
MPRSVSAVPLESLPATFRAACVALRDGLRTALGSDLRALYVYGAAMFPETEGHSDLDYHALVSRRPTADQQSGLQRLSDELARDHPPYGAELDGWVILLADARRSAPPAHLVRTELRDGAWALHRAHWLAGRCVIMYGPAPAKIVPEPTEAELRAALNNELDFAVSDPGDAFAVLNACRIIRSVLDRDVVQSKFGSAEWALEHLPARHADAIRGAMAVYRGDATPQQAAAVTAGRADILALAARELGR